MARVYYWQGVTGDFGRFAPYQSTILLLLQGEYKALNLERLRSASRHPIYSIRINSADRILFTTFAGKACLLDVVLEHRYAGSAFLKKGVLNTFLSTYEDAVFEAAEGLDLETVEETEALSVAPLAYFQSQFIELSLLQQTAVRASLPMIVTGPAGSGKTCLALSMLSNYCRAHRDEPMPVLYVCQSEALKRLVQAGWREIADETQFRTEVHFRTYDELIDDDKKGLATASDFSAWFEALPASAAEIKALGPKLVWREFRICSGDTTERYLQLGQRQSELSVPGVRTLLSEYYVKYLNHLHDKRLFSAELFPLETRSHYAFVAVDEAQGLSNLQLKSLCQLARGQIVYFLGVHQLLSDCKSHLFYLKELFRNASIEVTTVSLTATYRCPKRILDVANQLILLKKICTGGAEDKDEIPAMCVANDARADQGEAMLFRVEDAEAIGRLRELAKNNIQFAVVTLPLFKEEAKERFETPLIFTAEEIKGLEFKEVVIWKLFGDEDFRTAGKKLRGMDLEKVPKHRPKAGESDVSHAVPFNRAIIAVTRSSGQLYLFQKWDRDIDPIMRSIQSACRGTAIRADIRVEPVSPDQWKAQAAHLQAQGLTEQARAIYIDVLGLSEAEFVASHSSPKSDIEAHIEAGESAAVIVAGAPAGGSADTSVHDISKPARAALRLKRKKDTPSRADGAGAAEVSPTSALTLESLCRKCISLIHRLPKEKLYCDEVCPQILDLFIAYDSFLKEAELRAWFIKALSVNRDVLYMLCQSPEGIRKLRQLWRVEKDLIAAVSISTWIHVFSDKPRDHAKDSLLYKLSASEDGIYILYALLLTHPNLFRTIPSFAWGANTNTASGKNGYSPLFFLSGNEMGQQFLLSFFEKFPEKVLDIPHPFWSLPVSDAKLAGSTPVFWLCNQPKGSLFLSKLLKANPSLVTALSSSIWEMPMRLYPYRTPLYHLALHNSSVSLLLHFLIQEHPEIIAGISVELWGRAFDVEDNEGLSILFFLTLHEPGYEFLQALIHKCPEVVRKIPPCAWTRAIRSADEDNGTTIVSLMCRHDYTLRFLKTLILECPEIIQGMDPLAWDVVQSTGSFAGTWPLLLLIGSELGIECFNALMEKTPDLLRNIPSSAWGRVMMGTEVSPLYLLCESVVSEPNLKQILSVCEAGILNVDESMWTEICHKTQSSPLSCLAKQKGGLEIIRGIYTRLQFLGINEPLQHVLATVSPIELMACRFFSQQKTPHARPALEVIERTGSAAPVGGGGGGPI